MRSYNAQPVGSSGYRARSFATKTVSRNRGKVTKSSIPSRVSGLLGYVGLPFTFPARKYNFYPNFVAEGESADGTKGEYNPWPSYNFTGNLRPFPAGPKRTVPAHIGRPDYADHPTGFPASEHAAKGSGQIKVLDDEEIEGMRVACRLGREVLDEAAR